MKLKERLRKWLGVDRLERENDRLRQRLASTENAIDRKIRELDELTREDWDIGVRGPSTIILTGVYRGRGYVQFYDVGPDEFHHMVERYQSMRKSNLIRNVDAPRHHGSFDIFH